MIDFAHTLSDWLAECTKPAPACPVEPLTAGDAEQIWSTLAKIGIRRDVPARSIQDVVQRNPRARGLERLLSWSCAAATLKSGDFIPSLCRTRWNEDKGAADLHTAQCLNRWYVRVDLDDLPETHPYSVGIDRERLAGSVLYAEAEGTYQRPAIGDCYALEHVYHATDEVNRRLDQFAKAQAADEERRRFEEEIEMQARIRAAKGPERLAIEALQERVRQLEAAQKETP